MFAGLGCVGVGSWSSRGLDNGLRVGVNGVGGFYHVLKMSELCFGKIHRFLVDLGEDSMTRLGVYSSAVNKVVLQCPLRAVGGYAAVAEERFPAVFGLVEAKPVEIFHPAVVGDSFSIFHLGNEQQVDRIASVIFAEVEGVDSSLLGVPKHIYRRQD